MAKGGQGTTKRRLAVAASVAAVPLTQHGAFTSPGAPGAATPSRVASVASSTGAPQAAVGARSQSLLAPAAGALLTGLAAGCSAKKRSAKGTGVTTCLSTSTVLEKAATDAVEPAKLFEHYVKDRGGERVLRKLLIANNGMAATKAILSLRQWAYLELGSDNIFEFVVMATPEDLEANAEFIRLANSYVEVPGGKNVNNYANVDLIVDVAKTQGGHMSAISTWMVHVVDLDFD